MNEASTNNEPPKHSEMITPEEVRRALKRQEAIIQEYRKNPAFDAALTAFLENADAYLNEYNGRRIGVIQNSPPTAYEQAVIIPILRNALAVDPCNPLHLQLHAQALVSQESRPYYKWQFGKKTVGETPVRARKSAIPSSLEALIEEYCASRPEQSAFWTLPLVVGIDDIDIYSYDIQESLDRKDDIFLHEMRNFLSVNFNFSELIDLKVAELVHEKLSNIKEVSNAVAHWTDVLSDVVEIAGKMAPSLLPVIQPLEKSVLIFRPTTSSPLSIEQEQDNPLMQSLGDLSVYGEAFANTDLTSIYPPIVNLKDPKARNDVEKIYILHEFAHLIAAQLLANARATDNNDDRHVADTNRVPTGNLYRVIQEAVALTFEMSYMRLQLKNNSDSDSNNPTQALYDSRRTYLKESLKLWQSKTRRAFTGKQDTTTSSKEALALVYGEGARLANQLARQGWTVDKLPELVMQVCVLMQELVGSSKREDFEKILLEKAAGSTDNNGPSQYQLVKKRILALKPISPDDQRTRLTQTT